MAIGTASIDSGAARAKVEALAAFSREQAVQKREKNQLRQPYCPLLRNVTMR